MFNLQKIFDLNIKIFINYFIACSLQLICLQRFFRPGQFPYSRYGLGDLHPNTNILNRGMGGISAAICLIAAFSEFCQPCFLCFFRTFLEEAIKKIIGQNDA